MNFAQARDLVRRHDILYRADYKFDRGELIIISDHSHLKCVVFGHRQALRHEFEACCDNVMVQPLEKALTFFAAYFSNRSSTLPPVDLESYTYAERKVYTTLVSIPIGQTISYGELARLSGYPGGARFVGNTMEKNMFPIVIPCHRVTRSDGSTGNYSSGLMMKRYLLQHESSA